MKGILVAIISVFFLTAHAQPAPPPTYFLIHGVNRTCDSTPVLDRALSTEDRNFFAGWSSADFDTAAQWAALCVRDAFRFIGDARAKSLRAFQAKLAQQPPPEQVAADRRLAVQREQQRQDADDAAARRAQAEAQQARYAENLERKRQASIRCRHSGPYRVFQAQERLRADILTKDRIGEAMDREEKIEQRSGVQSLSRKYELGEQSVRIDEVIEKDWERYHLAGGESSADHGLMLIDNPCSGDATEE